MSATASPGVPQPSLAPVAAVAAAARAPDDLAQVAELDSAAEATAVRAEAGAQAVAAR